MARAAQQDGTASQETTETEPAAKRMRTGKPAKRRTSRARANGTISKADAVRHAIAEGKDTPAEGVPFIKDTFGIDIDPQHFSAQKSQIKRREGLVTGGRARKSRPRSVEGYVAPPRPTAGGEAGLLETLEALKPLVAQHGADKVKRLVDLLA